MEHHFSIVDAQKFGVEEAILLHNIKFWIQRNMANKSHERDGRTWTYNSKHAFSVLFPYWSQSQVKRILKSLINQNVLVTANYNLSGYDRTLWYAIDDKAVLMGLTETEWDGMGRNGTEWDESNSNKQSKTVREAPYLNISRFRPMHWTILTNPLDDSDQPIPDSKPDSKQHIKHTGLEFDSFYQFYPKKTELRRAKKIWASFGTETRAEAIRGIAGFIKDKEKRFICGAAVYLHGRRWEDEVINVNDLVYKPEAIRTGSQRPFPKETNTKPKAKPKQSLRESLNEHRRKSA